jgi:hypothetical protein
MAGKKSPHKKLCPIETVIEKKILNYKVVPINSSIKQRCKYRRQSKLDKTYISLNVLCENTASHTDFKKKK